MSGFARGLRLASQAPWAADLPAARPTRFHGDVQNPARLSSFVAPSVLAVRRRCRNVRLLGIGYALRPRLSARLTLGGLASPRKPRAYGGGVSRPSLVTHACILASARSTAGRPGGFAPARNAPLPAAPYKGAAPPLRLRA